MTKRTLLLGAAMLTLAAAAVQPAIAQTAASVRASAAATATKPQLGAWGYDAAGMDRAVKPGDDFYAYANGLWQKNTPIPDDRASWGGFGILRDLSDTRTREIIEAAAAQNNAPGSTGQKVGDMFASFMDEAAIERKGAAPLKPYLDKIAAIRTRTDLARALGEANRTGVSSPIGVGVEQDLKDNTIYAVYAGQGGLGLPDRDYYLVDNPKFAEARTRYQAHIAKMLTLAGVAGPPAKAQRIYDLEKKIAETHWTRAESRQIDKLYNPTATAELGAKYGGFDWNTYLQTAGLAGRPQVIVTQPSAVTGATKLLASEPIDTWKDYLTFHTVSSAAPLLSDAFVQESFEMSKVLSGTPKLKDRWKRGVDLVNGGMGEAVGELYVARHFTPDAKAKADELVKNLTLAMDARLQKLEWMAPDTRTKARAKLAAFRSKIGYPDKWRDYSALKVDRNDLVGNAMRARDFEYQRQLSKIGKPVDRDEWFMTPQTVNAYANPLMNEIVFPAAILQPPFFDPNADPAVNYGGIGAVIGHEISHHFDDQGSKFDPAGNMSVWWTPADVEKFKGYTDAVVKQYGAYEPLPGQKVNGALTLGENIADLAGLTIAYDAYRLSLNGREPPVIDGLTGDQRFFLGYAQIWRNKYRDEALQQALTTGPHTPGHFRPTVVRNHDAWYRAFNVQPGDRLYLPPEQRLRVW